MKQIDLDFNFHSKKSHRLSHFPSKTSLKRDKYLQKTNLKRAYKKNKFPLRPFPPHSRQRVQVDEFVESVPLPEKPKTQREEEPEQRADELMQIQHKKRKKSNPRTQQNKEHFNEPQPIQKQYDIQLASLELLEIHPRVLNSLQQTSVEKATQIQLLSFRPINQGNDTIIKAMTGSGKTLAYLIPLISRMLKCAQDQERKVSRQSGVVCLVLCPTRELCLQGERQALKCLKRSPFLITGSIIGGQNTQKEKARLRKGLNILFSTPGRFIYHLKNTSCLKIDGLRHIVFQEADQILDLGFKRQLSEIIELLKSKSNFQRAQKVLVSANFSQDLKKLVQQVQFNQEVLVGFQKKGEQSHKQIPLDKVLNVPDRLRQNYILTEQQNKIPLLLAFLSVTPSEKILIFVSTCNQVQFLFRLISWVNSYQNGLQLIQDRTVHKLHGSIPQQERSSIYFSFRKQKRSILISTDVAARGLDFPQLDLIIIFDIPDTPVDYSNRIGRTARFKSGGQSLLMLHHHQQAYAHQIDLLIKSNMIRLESEQTYMKFGQRFQEEGRYFLRKIIRRFAQSDQQHYSLARKAYVSMLRAYARLRDKQIFVVKKLNLKHLASGFGLNSVKSRGVQEQRKQTQREYQQRRKMGRGRVNLMQVQRSQFV